MDLLERYESAELTYAEAGATRRGELPDGYRHLRYRMLLGPTPTLRPAAEALLTWQMHEKAGMRPVASAPRAAAGVTVISRLGLGPVGLLAPCRVVWTVDEPGRAGFAYGTLPGHPESGEEAFLLELDDSDRVWFSISAFTRSRRWYTRVAGPAVGLLQRLLARRYAAALRDSI